MKPEVIKFEINPLDINLAKIEMNLINRCKKEMPDYENFTTIEETFKSKDPSIDFSEIKIVCQYDSNKPGLKKENRLLSAQISQKNGDTKNLNLFAGTKKELLEYLGSKNFFKTCKYNCLNK